MGCRLVQAATLAAFIHIVFTSEVIAQDPTDLNKDDVPGRMLTTDFIITGTDYRIDRHSDVFYAYVDKFSCSGDRLFLILCSP